MSDIPPALKTRLDGIGNSVQERRQRFSDQGMIALIGIMVVMLIVFCAVAWPVIEPHLNDLISMRQGRAVPPAESPNIAFFVIKLLSVVFGGLLVLVVTLMYLARRCGVECSECARLINLRWNWKKAEEHGACPFCGKPIRNFYRDQPPTA